jgi:hypothetical protein
MSSPVYLQPEVREMTPFSGEQLHNFSIVQLEVRDGGSTRSSSIVENSFCSARILLCQKKDLFIYFI